MDVNNCIFYIEYNEESVIYIYNVHHKLNFCHGKYVAYTGRHFFTKSLLYFVTRSKPDFFITDMYLLYINQPTDECLD